MKFNIVGYLIGEGFKNTFKNKKSTFSAMLVMCISMIIFGLFFILGENVNHIMETVEDAQAMQVFIKLDATDEEVEEVGKQLEQIEGISKVEFLSKEEGFEQYKSGFGDKGYILDPYKDTLPDSYIVTFTDLKLADEVEAQINGLDNIKNITSSNQTISKLIKITQGIRIVTAVILIGLVFGAIFIISNTIKLTVYARRKEISIMKYVGATNSFIRWPFIVEGIIIGIISACISILIVGGLYKLIATNLLASTTIQNMGITFVSFGNMFNMLIIVYLVLGIGIGVLGSSISMRKYLEV